MKKIYLSLILILTVFLSGLTLAADSISISYVQSLSDIPIVDGDLTKANDNNKVGKVTFITKTTGHQVNVQHPNGTKYILASSGNNPITIELPGINEYGTLILDSGIYFKGEDGKRYIYYEYQNPASDIEYEKSVFDLTNQEFVEQGFRPYVIWNVETGVYDIVDKLTLYAIFHAGSYRRAYADIVFPMDIDDLLMVNIKWNYRYIKPLGLGYTEWRNDNTIRYKDEIVTASNFWNEFKKWIKIYPFFTSEYYSAERWNQETIQDLGVLDDTYKFNYVQKVNTHLINNNLDTVTTNDVFFGLDGYSAYRVYLNTYSAGFYTGYQIEDIVLVDIAYIYKGEYFHPRITDIEWTAVGGSNRPESKTLIDYLNEFIKFLDTKFGWLKFPVLIIIGIIILAAINRLWIRIRRFIG